MAKLPGSRVPSTLGSIPVLGDIVRSADGQAQWLRELLEQNARLVGQFPATMKSFNDSLERFNQTVGRLDAAVSRIESAGRSIAAPVEKLTGAAGVLDPKALRDLPEAIESLRREAVPAMRAVADTQRQVDRMQSTLDRIVGLVADLPGAGVLRRLAAGGRGDGPAGASESSGGRPRPPTP